MDTQFSLEVLAFPKDYRFKTSLVVLMHLHNYV